MEIDRLWFCCKTGTDIVSDEKTTVGIIGAIMLGITEIFSSRTRSKVVAISERLKKLEDARPVGSDTLRYQVSVVAASVNKAEHQLRKDMGRIEQNLSEHMKNSADNYRSMMGELSELKNMLLEDAFRKAQR